MFLYASAHNRSIPVPKIVTQYCDPFFHQDWKLFVPPPDKNYRILTKIPGEGTVDVLNEILRKHQSNRLSGNAHLLLSFINYIHYFEKSTTLTNGFVKEDQRFDMLLYATKQYLQQTRELQINELKIYLVLQGTKGNPALVYYN